MNFKLFLEKTISDILSSAGEEVKLIKKEVRDFLQNHLQGRDLDTAVNLFAYIYSSEEKGEIEEDWNKFRDYLTVNLSHNRTLFVNPITRKQLESLNDRYHLNLKLADKNLRKGPKGEALVEVSKELVELNNLFSLPNNFNPNLWAGWKWVSLGCGHSGQEAAAGGHCGNAGAERGDNIFSLRNPNDQVLLTFIVNVNTGYLGESKAVNNEKPKKELHPAIVALLSSKYVKGIQGGGYLPEKNFQLEDLKYNNELYQYFTDHLSGKKVHKTPENYLPLSWLTQLSPEIIHVKYPTATQKVKLLEDILNVFSNYQILSADKDEKFTPIPIRIDLADLVEECLKAPEAQNVKYLLDLYSKVVNIYSSNRLWGSYMAKTYRPDLNAFNMPPEDEDGFIDYVKKVEKINIDQNTVEDILKKILSKKLNLRDKINLLGTTTRAAGHGYAEKPGAMFSKYITDLTHQVARDCYNAQIIPNYAGEDLMNYIGAHMEEKDMSGLSFNIKKQKLIASLHETYILYEENQKTREEEAALDSELKKILVEFKKDFIENGVHLRRRIEQNIIGCVVKDFKSDFVEKVRDTLFMNYGYSKNKNQRFLFKRYDIKELIKKAMNKENITFAKEIKNEVSECRNKVFHKMFKNLRKFVKQNFEKICECAKEAIKITQSFRVPERIHKSKIRYETPEQLAKQRRVASYALRKSEYEKLIKSMEERRYKREQTPFPQQESLQLKFKDYFLG